MDMDVDMDVTWTCPWRWTSFIMFSFTGTDCSAAPKMIQMIKFERIILSCSLVHMVLMVVLLSEHFQIVGSILKYQSNPSPKIDLI